ncbi:DUF4846 domain-containing protein [Mucilaginibacter sp. CSA2-8R]|uniref:DUF4846 domain-containing protein n=1 Tax=Mucilaginibacter sp. CSA2-8R TaxID=3141542 RepID=UPI00315D8265
MLKALLWLLLLVTLHPNTPIVKTGNTVGSRFKAPTGYNHAHLSRQSFGDWLLHRPLKPVGTPTLTYAGNFAHTNRYTAGVLDISVRKNGLQQCADAAIRLIAEYLYSKRNYRALHFNFTSGFNCDFVHFAEGYRYQQNGTWKKLAPKSYSYNTFQQYLDLVFSYAGTLSLERELQPVNNAADIQAGDLFIKGGSPGHCFIVMNVVENKTTRQKKFLLAQSFIPAQNIQIVQSDSPWFSLYDYAMIPYGQLINKAYLKRFNFR